MLTSEQQAAYDRDGFVVLPGAVPKDAALRMCDRLWGALERKHGIVPDDAQTWTRAMPRGLGNFAKSGAFDELASKAVVGAVDQILGADTWEPPSYWGGPLAAFPESGPWDVPSAMWHLDYPVRRTYGLRFAVKLLALLAPLEPEGGGTLLLEGSHRVNAAVAERLPPGDPGNSMRIRGRLSREHAWFRDLLSKKAPNDRRRRFMEEGADVEGVHLRVVEFTGDAGDALLFHPWLFHAPAPNCRETPRMMLGQNLTTREGLSIYARRSPRPDDTAP